MSTSESVLFAMLVIVLSNDKGYRVDIVLDTLEEKSWKRPSADVSDYNFWI